MIAPAWLQVVVVLCGCVAILGVAAVVGWAIFVTILDRSHSRRARAFAEGREFERRKLREDATWFSEDAQTMLLLEEFASLAVDDARARWRSRRKDRRVEGEEARRG